MSTTTWISLWHSGGIVESIGDCQNAIETWNLSLQHLFLQYPRRSSLNASKLRQKCLVRSTNSSRPYATDSVFFRQYCAIKLPEHDTLQHSSSNGLIESSPDSLPVNMYHPYPNQSSFLLGEWYWNGGEKKSQSSFRNLLQIVGHPSFCPEDVSGTNWRLIDAKLSGERLDSLDDDDTGANKQSEANKRSKENQPSEAKKQSKRGWIQTPVKINVPFHSRMLHPGPKYFDAGVLHHRRLISVIKKKVKVNKFPPFSSLAHTSTTTELLPKPEVISSSSCCSATSDGGRVC